MKRGEKGFLFFVSLIFIFVILSFSLVSAGWFSDRLNKITGKVVYSCTETDNGDDPYVKGTLSGMGEYTDICISNSYVREYFCNENNQTLMASRPCENGCEDGACVASTIPVPCTSFNYSSWSTCSSSGTQTRTIISSSPSGCTGGNPILNQSCTPPSTCFDFDNSSGITSYYSKSNLTTSTGLFYEDKCVDNSLSGSELYSLTEDGRTWFAVSVGQALAEANCSAQDLLGKPLTIVGCPYGCEDGACKSGDSTLEPPLLINSPGRYVLEIGDVINVSGIYGNITEITWALPIDGEPHVVITGENDRICEVYAGKSCNLSSGELSIPQPIYLEITINDITKNQGDPYRSNASVTILSKNRTIMCEDSDGPMNYYLAGNCTDYFGRTMFDGCIMSSGNDNDGWLREINCTSSYTCSTSDYNCPYGCQDGVCLPKPQVCQSLINKIKNPVETYQKRLLSNNTYRNSYWVNGQEEKYTSYHASWIKAAEDSQNGLTDYYLSYQIEIFDNQNINLSGLISSKKNYPFCEIHSYWNSDDGEEIYYSICNWDVLGNSQDLNNNYQNTHRDIYWYKENVVIYIYIQYGKDLTNEEIIKLSQKEMENLIDSLKDNSYTSLDWESFELPWPVWNEVSAALMDCGSDVVYNWSTDYKSWEWKIEPTICPPHGYQTKISRSYNIELGKYDTFETRISCSPGICSGCYVPKWFGEVGEETKCIPYGFRFEQKTGDFERIWKESGGEWKEETEDEILSETNEEDFSLNILSETTAHLVLAYWNVSLDLVEGQESKFSISEGDEEENSIMYTLNPINIIYYAEGDSRNYVEMNITAIFFAKNYTWEEGKPIVFNMYCDIDGELKVQKNKDYFGEWAKCQNNYECYSNLCSSGECIEINDMLQEVSRFKRMGIQIVCRINSFFSSQSYDECIGEYLI